MEHIRKAVEIAETALQEPAITRGETRSRSVADDTAERDEARARTTRGSPAVVARQKHSATEKITYTDTGTVRLSPDVLRENRVLLSSENNASAAAYKMLRTQVLQRMRENNWNALGITSCRAGEGKSLTAINLAISLASVVNYTVLLVDADLRRPKLHEYLGYLPSHGLDDYLLDEMPLKDILVNPQIDRLVILPGHNPVANSSELLSSPKMISLVEDLKTRYASRLLIFDLPPLLSTDDALAFSPFIDAVLLVLEQGATSRDELKRARKLLSDSNLLGTVLNKSDEKNPGYY